MLKVRKNDMTNGNIVKTMLIYTVPLIIANIFQLLYSTIDIAVIGQFTDTLAVDSVGAATSIINVISFLIIGLCNGASILMSEFYGAKNKEKLKNEIGLCFTIFSIFSIIAALVVMIFAKQFLIATNVKAELIEGATTYLVVSMIGVIFVMIYTIIFTALRSMGDSISPLIILVLSCCINIGLDFFFVAGLKKGILGAALATITAQGITAVIAIIYALITNEHFKLKISDFMIRKELLIKTIKYSLASALQQVVLYIGKLLVQSEVNKLDFNEQAGFTFGTKIDDYALEPSKCLGQAVAVFIAQNRGAKQAKRAKKGYLYGLLMQWGMALIISLVVLIFKAELVKIFTKDAINQKYAVMYLGVMGFIYLMPGTTNGLQSYFRGLGNLLIVFLSTSFQILFRVGSAFIFIPMYGVRGTAFSTFTGWVFMILFELPILIIFWKKNIRMPQEEEETELAISE